MIGSLKTSGSGKNKTTKTANIRQALELPINEPKTKNRGTNRVYEWICCFPVVSPPGGFPGAPAAQIIPSTLPALCINPTADGFGWLSKFVL